MTEREVLVAAARARIAARLAPSEPTPAEANRLLDEALEVRVRAHRAREAGELSVPDYLAQLRWARDREDDLEPIRQGAYRFSRAYERCTVRSDGYQRA